MIGTAELARVLARPPVNLEVMGLERGADLSDITDEQRAMIEAALIRFWASEDVNWLDVTDWARSFARASQRELFAGVEMTMDEHDMIEDALTFKHLSGFAIGWMLARGMGDKSEEETECL